jgi:aryl-alcohol dehydrogenase-like predicted oxidoreductase
MTIPQRTLGVTGYAATILGLGGEGVLRTFGQEREAQAVIEAALAEGINYFETARAYSGSEAYLGPNLKGHRDKIFLTSKSHGRSFKEAMAHLTITLKNLDTDYLDLWQVHDIRRRVGPWRPFIMPGTEAGCGSSASPATMIRKCCAGLCTCMNSIPCSCR